MTLFLSHHVTNFIAEATPELFHKRPFSHTASQLICQWAALCCSHCWSIFTSRCFPSSLFLAPPVVAGRWHRASWERHTSSLAESEWWPLACDAPAAPPPWPADCVATPASSQPQTCLGGIRREQLGRLRGAAQPPLTLTQQGDERKKQMKNTQADWWGPGVKGGRELWCEGSGGLAWKKCEKQRKLTHTETQSTDWTKCHHLPTQPLPTFSPLQTQSLNVQNIAECWPLFPDFFVCKLPFGFCMNQEPLRTVICLTWLFILLLIPFKKKKNVSPTLSTFWGFAFIYICPSITNCVGRETGARADTQWLSECSEETSR